MPPLPLPSLSLVPLVAIANTLFVAFAFTCPPPSLPSYCHSGEGEEDHPNPVRNPTLATAASVAIIIAAVAFATFAAPARSNYVWAYIAWQTACADAARLLLTFVERASSSPPTKDGGGGGGSGGGGGGGGSGGGTIKGAPGCTWRVQAGSIGQLLHLPAQAHQGGGVACAPRQPGQQRWQWRQAREEWRRARTLLDP
jgi:hypothetical protein